MPRVTQHPIMATYFLAQTKYARYVDQVMCKNTLSIDWQGYVYDCVFNQILHLPFGSTNQKTHLKDITKQ